MRRAVHVSPCKGGPGGSGVEFVRSVGKELQELLGEDHDIVGFDPRFVGFFCSQYWCSPSHSTKRSGVGFSVPAVKVFVDDAETASWRIKEAADPLPNMTADAMSRIYARLLVYNGLAKVRASIATYVSTASVARDMLGIMNAHGYDKIQYWGFS